METKPTIGAPVHYVTEGGCRAAIVIGLGKHTTLIAFLLPDEGGVTTITDCLHDEKKKPAHTWHWPEGG